MFFNTILVAGLLLATEPLLAVLMLGRLGFAPWQYALAFASRCVGGLIGARLSRRLVGRCGPARVMLGAGALRACWPIGLVFIGRGIAGIALVIGLQFGLVTCIGVFNPVMATYRLEQTAPDRVARMLSAWTISSSATIAALTAVWGVLASVIGVRAAIGIAGALLLAHPTAAPATVARTSRASPSRRGPRVSRRLIAARWAPSARADTSHTQTRFGAARVAVLISACERRQRALPRRQRRVAARRTSAVTSSPRGRRRRG